MGSRSRRERTASTRPSGTKAAATSENHDGAVIISRRWLQTANAAGGKSSSTRSWRVTLIKPNARQRRKSVLVTSGGSRASRWSLTVCNRNYVISA